MDIATKSSSMGLHKIPVGPSGRAF